MLRSLILVAFVTKLFTRTRPNFLSSSKNYIKFRTKTSSETLKFIGSMDLNDDLMRGDDGDVLEDTFGDEFENLRPLPDGEFTVKSKKYNNFVLDLSENVDGGIIHSYEYNSGDNQTWLLNYDSDKEGYILKNKQNPDLLLSWNCHDATKENIIRGFTNNDSRNHYWRIEQTDDGYFKFKNLNNSNMILTIQDIFSSFGGKQVTMNTEISSDQDNCEKWIINPVFFQTIQDGNYNIFNRNLPDIVIGLNDNQEDSLVHAQRYSVKENQEWKLSYDREKEAYTIKCALNLNLLLAWDSNSATKEMVLGAYKDSGNKSQYWRIERTDDGSYRLRNLEHLNSILILNAASFDGQKSGLKLIVHKDSSDDANIHSRWTIKPVSYQSISDGDYNIFNRNLTDIVIDYSNREDSLVHGHNYIGNDSQTWTFEYNKEKKAYIVKNGQNTDLLLCWNSNATSQEMFLRAYSESRCKNQYWRIEKVNDGSYRLRDLENTEKLITVIDKDSPYGGKELIVTDSKDSGDKITVSNSWFLQKIGKAAIPNGKFKIATKANYKKVINSNQESKLIITDNLNLVTSDWEIKYDSTKRAYTIHSSKFKNLGWVYQNKNCFVTLDNIDGSNLRNYWMVEYKMQAGGYLIRSLCDPSQAVSYSDNNPITTDNATYSVNQLFNFIRN